MCRWKMFGSGSAIDNASAPAQLFQCANTELSDNVLKSNPQVVESNLTDLLAEMRSPVTMPVANGISCNGLFRLHRKRDDPILII